MEKITLPNGFRIILEPVSWARSATMGVWIASGSRFENRETSGISHFIEHMLFKGTEKRTALDIAEQMDEIGGILNAYTSKEYTCFYARALDTHVPTAFDIIADMLTCPKLSENDLETEKGVIIEEIGMYEDSPEDVCIDGLYGSVWPDNMLGANILGTRETVKAMTTENLRDYMKKMYVPERMVAAFSGSFNRDEIIGMCEKYFGGMQNTNNPMKSEPVEYHQSVYTIKKDFEQTQIALGLPGLSIGDENRFALSILHSIMGNSSSSRLYQRLREDLGLVYSVDSFSTLHLGGGLTGISMALSPKSEKEALQETFKVMHGLIDSISGRELSRAKEQYKATLVMGLESTASLAAYLGRSELLTNKIQDTNYLIERINSVTLDELQSFTNNILDFGKFSISVAGRVNSPKFYKGIVSDAKNMV